MAGHIKPFHFDEMCRTSQYQVACEFGYPEDAVSVALQEHQFKDAGSLVEYLEQCGVTLNGEEEEEEEEEARKTICPDAPTNEERRTDSLQPSGEFSLREETQPVVHHRPPPTGHPNAPTNEERRIDSLQPSRGVQPTCSWEQCCLVCCFLCAVMYAYPWFHLTRCEACVAHTWSCSRWGCGGTQ